MIKYNIKLGKVDNYKDENFKNKILELIKKITYKIS